MTFGVAMLYLNCILFIDIEKWIESWIYLSSDNSKMKKGI